MLAALPTQPSFGLGPIVPLFPSLFSVTSALKSRRGLTTQLATREHQPNHFPLFPHPVNIARAGTPANPFPSIVYFTNPGHPGGGGTCASRLLGSHSTPRARTLAATLSPLDATLTQMHGGHAPHTSARLSTHYSLLTTRYSPPTTHFPNQSATLSLRGTHDPR
jgi:hypothetical protein